MDSSERSTDSFDGLSLGERPARESAAGEGGGSTSSLNPASLVNEGRAMTSLTPAPLPEGEGRYQELRS